MYDVLGRWSILQDRGAPQQTRLGDRLAAGIYAVEALQAGEKVERSSRRPTEKSITYDDWLSSIFVLFDPLASAKGERPDIKFFLRSIRLSF